MISSDLYNRFKDYYNFSEDEFNEILNDEKRILTSNSDHFKKVIKRLEQAKNKKEKILIIGDYDADGITSCAILVRTLRKIGNVVNFIIPKREEGYGINLSHVDIYEKYNFDLLIAIDNGVKSFDVIEKCLKQNIDLMIIDHHQYDSIPEDVYFLHSFLLEDDFKNFSAAGLAFLLANYFLEDDYNLCLAAIGLVADCMPLLKQNRTIIKKAMEYLKKNIPSQIKFLVNNQLSFDSFGFEIGPKINAIGRLSQENVNLVVKYLISENSKEIEEFSKVINKNNEKRKRYVSNYMNKGFHFFEEYFNMILIFDCDLLEGMCGLIANRIKEKYKKPCLVLCGNGDELKGSARSYGDFDCYEYFQKLSFLKNFGGHKNAVGLSIKKIDFDKLKEYFESTKILIKNEFKVISVKSDEIDFKLLEFVERLKPFGQNLIEPLFEMSNFKIKDYLLLKDIYPKWKLENNIDAISFKIDHNVASPNKFIGCIKRNDFKKGNINFIVKHIL